jgi:pimeloyl-ACP methyl ester carboxylesterase
MTATSAQIQPVKFGPSGRLLFGIFHPASAVETPRASVLLCHAFGQEAVRADRLMRVLAERLARAGHAVLRFDLHGTGDSMGDDLDGDLEGWAHDVHEASRELRLRSRAAQSVWIGMRLGATVALRAAQQAPDDLRRLILWDPVLDGARYLAHLRARHVASLEEAFSLMPAPTPSELAHDPRRFSDEAIGFALSPLLREQLVALRLPEHRWPARPASIVVLTDPDDADGRDLVSVCATNPGRVAVIPVRHGTDWTTAAADNSALVPAAAMMQLVHHAGAPA